MSNVVTTITHQDQVWPVSFSPDGTYLATVSSGSVETANSESVLYPSPNI